MGEKPLFVMLHPMLDAAGGLGEVVEEKLRSFPLRLRKILTEVGLPDVRYVHFFHGKSEASLATVRVLREVVREAGFFAPAGAAMKRDSLANCGQLILGQMRHAFREEVDFLVAGQRTVKAVLEAVFQTWGTAIQCSLEPGVLFLVDLEHHKVTSVAL